MGTYHVRGNRYRCVVRKHGAEMTTTVDSAAEAKIWIEETEAMLRNRKQFGGGMNLGGVLQQHIDEVLKKKNYDTSTAQSGMTKHIRDLGTTEICDINKAWWMKTVRGFDVSPSSAQRYMMAIAGALRRAENLSEEPSKVRVNWDAYREARTVLTKEGVISDSKERDRRPDPTELAALKAHMPDRADFIDFAVTTGMRLSEICRLEWRDLNTAKGLILIRMRKHPTAKEKFNQTVPLLFGSLDIVMRQPRVDRRIFPIKPTSFTARWRDACKKLGIEDLHFHDLRHEAISRMFELGAAAWEVKMVSGHKSDKCLARYLNAKPEDLHKGFAKVRALAAQYGITVPQGEVPAPIMLPHAA